MSLRYLECPRGLLEPEILDDGRNLICLQSNCVARKRHYGSIHDKLYNALGFGDPYRIRGQKECVMPRQQSNLARPADRPKLGSFLIQQDKETPASKCGVAFLFAQYNMGNGRSLYFSDDEYVAACKKFEGRLRESRLEAFKQCLTAISSSSPTLEKFDRILFPMGIGCFKAGGHWPDYLKAIEEFGSKVDINVYIVKATNFE